MTSIKVLFIGDIVGRPGRTLLIEKLGAWRKAYAIDIVLANAENAAGGMGLTKATAEELLAAGIDAITLGNHVWDQRGFEKDIDTLPSVCRPANLPEKAPGSSYVIVEKGGFRLAVFTLLGRHNIGMEVQDSREIADRLLKDLKDKVDAFFVEIHAELTAEKQIHGIYLEGRVAAVVGTHTHVPTADERILPGGTAFQTDVGMTGVRYSIIGFDPKPILEKSQDGLPRRWSVADGVAHLDGIVVTINIENGLAESCQRVCWS